MYYANTTAPQVAAGGWSTVPVNMSESLEEYSWLAEYFQKIMKEGYSGWDLLPLPPLILGTTSVVSGLGLSIGGEIVSIGIFPYLAIGIGLIVLTITIYGIYNEQTRPITGFETGANTIIDKETDPLGREIPLREYRWEHIKQRHPELFDDKTEEEVLYEIKQTIRNPSEIWWDKNGDAPQSGTYFYFREFEPNLYWIVIVGNIGVITSYVAGVDEIFKKCGSTKPYEVNVYPGGKVNPL